MWFSPFFCSSNTGKGWGGGGRFLKVICLMEMSFALCYRKRSNYRNYHFIFLIPYFSEKKKHVLNYLLSTTSWHGKCFSDSFAFPDSLQCQKIKSPFTSVPYLWQRPRKVLCQLPEGGTDSCTTARPCIRGLLHFEDSLFLKQFNSTYSLTTSLVQLQARDPELYHPDNPLLGWYSFDVSLHKAHSNKI